MSPEEWLQKARLRYVVQTYLPGIEWAYLARRCRDNCNENEQEHVRRHSILQTRDFFRFVDQRAVLSYFELKPPVLKPAFVRVLAQILVREYALVSGDLEERIQPASRALAEFILYGSGSPFAILHNSPFAASELSFEHLAPSVSPETADPDQKQRAIAFLRGGRPLDWDIIRDVALARPIEDDLLNGIQSEQLVVLTGSAGDGKSTILKRAALALREAKWRVLITEPPAQRPFPSVGILGSSSEPTCLLVDNADLASSFPVLESELVAAPNLRVVLCARSYQWERKRFVLSRKLTLSVPTVDGPEIDQLAERLSAWRASGRPRTPEELKAAILRSVHGEHPHLLAAMMTATHGVSFRTIIERMIDEFEDANEQWALRLVACGALFEELSLGAVGRLPGPIFLTIVGKRLNPKGAPGDRLSELARARLRAFASEIVSYKPPASHAVSQYDLRHPDITNQVLLRYFGTRWGDTVGDVNLLEEDLYEIVSAECINLLQRKSEYPDRLSYAGTTAVEHFKGRGGNFDWISTEVARTLARLLTTVLGNTERELRYKQMILLQWARYESYLENMDEQAPTHSRRSDALYEEACQLGLGGEPWRQWAQTTIARGSLGSWDSPEPNSARGIYRRAWEEGVHHPGLLRDWMALEASDGHLGDVQAPVEKSARWIARWAWEAQIRAPTLIAKWTQLEAKSRNVGSFDDPAPYTVRWIYRKQNEVEERDENLLTNWFILEENARNIGDVENPAQYTARWIARHAWDLGFSGGNVLSSWMKMEASEGNLGDPQQPSQYSARWIAREMGETAFVSESLLAAVMALEERDGRIGEIEAPAEWTARWYAQQAWQRGMRGKYFLSTWASLEMQAGNLGSVEQPERYSARWIGRSAWNSGIRDSRLIVQWLNLEARAGNIGDYFVPAPYTFRWIGRGALAGNLLEANWLVGLMKLEQELGNLGDASDPIEFSARWIGRRAWLKGARDDSFLTGWVVLEVLAGNIGDVDTPAEFTARWILRTAWAEQVRGNTVTALWIMIEGQNGNIGDAEEPRMFTARWIARAAWASGMRSENVISEWHVIEATANDANRNDEHTKFTLAWILAETGYVPSGVRPAQNFAPSQIERATAEDRRG